MAPTEHIETKADLCESSDSTSKKCTTTAIANYASIEEFSKNGLSEIMAATKSVNSYPQAASRDLYCAYPTFGKIIDHQSDRILGLISKVLKWQNVKGNIQRRQHDEQFEMLQECNDAMLERLSTNLDDLAGIKRNPQTIVVESRLQTNPGTPQRATKGAGSWNLRKTETKSLSARLITAKNIARPQIKFKVPVDNSASKPFEPLLKDKPNSLKPLAILPEYDEAGNITSFLHPYEFELMKFEVSQAQLQRKAPQRPAEPSDTELAIIDTIADLRVALKEIRQHRELAIDVEHHSYRTFLGFTCLVQISTRAKDYLFDALALREEMHILNEVLTDPKIVKIFHGADSDVEWLQRDLSLYVVNMFDTHQAAKALNFARLSLSYLLKHYCNIEADKTFQLADWRIRPLPAELVAYARQDTHFLIYIYECLTNDLLDATHQQNQLLRSIYQRSTELCKKRYAKPVMASDSHMDFFRKSKRIFDNRQLFALRELFRWRDQVARVEDESYGYVLPNHMMLQIAESLPREMQGILACCNPIPPLVRQHLHALHQIVLKAREQPLVKPIFETDAIHRVASAQVKDYNSKLYCPHDLSHYEEFRDDLPTLLTLENDNSHRQTVGVVQMCKPQLSVFDTPEQSEEDEDLQKQKLILEKTHFISPYQRYMAILPLVAKEKLEEAAKLEAENKKRQLCPEAVILPIKEENIKPEQADDELYSLPVKEFLKRKYEESVAKKAANAITSNDAPKVKRPKVETTPTADKLKFVDLTKTNNQNNSKSKNPQKQTPKPTVTKNAAEVVVINSDDSNEPPLEMPSTSQAMQTPTQQSHSTVQRSKKFNKNKYKYSKAQQSSDKPVQTNFDYKNVDFRKFRGGAQYAKGAELKPQFHGKNNTNKAKNKKFNKLFTFSNVKGHK